MGTYEHGFVVKSKEELEELMGTFGSNSWRNRKGKWIDAFVNDKTGW